MAVSVPVHAQAAISQKKWMKRASWNMKLPIRHAAAWPMKLINLIWSRLEASDRCMKSICPRINWRIMRLLGTIIASLVNFTNRIEKEIRSVDPIKWRLELNERQTRIHFERMQLAKRVHFRPVWACITSGANNATTQQWTITVMENSDRAIDAVMENENGEKVESAHRQESKFLVLVEKT